MRAFLFCLLLASAFSPIAAHATDCIRVKPIVRTSALGGQVFDSTGAFFPEAKVSVSSAGWEGLEIMTDERGFFSVPGLAAGRYEVSVSFPGFSWSQATIDIQPALPFQLLLLRLAIGGECETRGCGVLVPAPAPVARPPECVTGQSAEKAAKSLFKIATTDPDSLVRRAAVARIDDARRLAEIARTDKASDVRIAAIMKITDQAVLRRIAKKEDEWSVRQAVEQRLKDLKQSR